MIRYFLFTCFCLATCSLSAQKTLNPYPRNYFRWPLDLNPEIVANMGELRNNHWHMGLDIRTDQKVNQLVYAAAEGYIAYVGIRPLSYGRFIIINHPNGLSTLYGHLNDFAPALEEYITAQQYQKESWAIELPLKKDQFPVSKGSFIAYSGTTGGSQGPHVHFEIRDTKTDKCLNPLLFGMPLSDNVRPTMVKLALYDRNRSVYDQSPKFFALKNTDEGYIIPKMPVLKTNLSKLSFGLQSYDRITGSANQDGIYIARLFADDQLQVSFVIDSIDYNDTRYMNAQIDYKYHANGGPFLQHLSKMPGDKGNIYREAAGDGTLLLNDTDIHDIRIEIEDSYGNQSVLNFKLQYTGDAVVNSKSLFPVFTPGYVGILEKPDFEVMIPDDCLYDTVRAVYFRGNSAGANAVSAVHQLNEETIPLHGDMAVRIKADKIIPENWKNKLVIRRTYRGSTTTRVAQLQDQPSAGGQWLSASFDDFGTFQAFADLGAPSVNELGRGDTINLSAASRILFTPTDNFGIRSFRAELDGQWLRFTNDKGRSWIYIFDERCPYGVHQLKVTVTDLVGNSTTKSWWFKKYPYTPPKKKVVKKKKGSTKKRKK
jgi:murein DD-endopeptidase MepM/ murein hydrolase activator NlpD